MLPVLDAFVPPALNLDVHGKPLTYRSAKNGPDRLLWERAEADELIRLLDSNTIVPIRHSDTPPIAFPTLCITTLWSSKN
jgi:hypothetical protein